jgi:hypothetical protein
MSDVGDIEARDAQDRAEALDSDVLSDDTDDPEGELEYPPEHLLGARGYGTTAAEERVDEPLDERMRREVADPLDEVDEPDADELDEIEAEEAYVEDTLEDEIAEELDEDDVLARARPVGRLVEPGADDDGYDLVDEESDAIATSADEDEEDLSAEEEAIHITADPPFGEAGDGYVS